MINQYKQARRVAVPLIAINTPDQPATLQEISRAEENAPVAVIRWDLIRGAVGIDAAGISKQVLAQRFGDSLEIDSLRLEETLRRLMDVRDCVTVVLNSHRFIEDPAAVQAICNCRDAFTQNGSCLVMLAPMHKLPPEFANDTLLLDEPLPSQEQIKHIVADVVVDAELQIDAETLNKAADALTGLSSFAAEQATALALTRNGVNLDSLWERKRQMISATGGLKVYRGGETFAQIQGYINAKQFMRRILDGPGAPRAIVFIDEIDKSVGAASSQGDTSGVSQDQLGWLLAWMEDMQVAGVLYIGIPGSGKSLMAKAAGNEGNIPTAQLDLGGLKGSLVGQSEANIRAATKVIDAISGGRTLVIATCNRRASLPPEMLRRFRLGTFYFDLPDDEEKKAIWSMYINKYSLPDQEIPNDSGWTGAEVKQACEVAWRLSCSLVEAATFITPVSRSAPQDIANLRNEANGRYISASYSGTYDINRREAPVEPARRRQISINS